MDELIAQTSKALNARGIRGSLIAHRNSLYWRAYFTDASGQRSQKRIHIGLNANKGQLLEAERRVIELAAAVGRLGMLPDPLPWATETRKSPELAPATVTVAEASTLLEQSFWKGKARTSAAERTWERIRLELRRLPEASPALRCLRGCRGRQVLSTTSACRDSAVLTRRHVQQMADQAD